MGNEINNLKAFGEFVVDTDKKLLWYENEPVKLPLKAVELLCVLIEHRGEVVSKEELLDKVWQDSFVEEGILSQNIYRLRKAFKKYGNEDDLIQTVPRRGYRFSGEINEIFEEEISIERTTLEKKIIAEKITFDEENAEIRKVQTQPRNTLPSYNFRKNALAFLAIVLLSLTAIGATVWYWKPNGDNQSSDKKFKFSPESIDFSRLTNSGKAFFPSISRDKQNLAYVKFDDEKWSVVLQHIPTKSETVIVKPQKYELRSLNFSADGNYIYYAAREEENPESTIYQIPIYGGTKRKIQTRVRHHFSISKSGEKMAYFRFDTKTNETHLIVANIDGTNEKIINTRKPSEYFRVWGRYPDWSYDDKKLVVTAYSRNSKDNKTFDEDYFLEIDVETGREKKIKTPDWEKPFQAFWQKNGKGFIVSVKENSSNIRQLWHLEYPSGKATRITNDTNHYYEFKPTFDFEEIIVMNRKTPANLFLINLENSEKIEQLTKETTLANGYLGLSWTKDGENLVYVKSESSTNAEIWKLNLESKEQQQLTFDKGVTVGKIEMMPDGKSMLFDSDREGNWHIWQMDLDGRNLKKYLDENSVMRPEITADNRFLLYRRVAEPQNGLKKVLLNGGEKEFVMKNIATVIETSPTDSDVAVAGYYDPNEEKNPWKCIVFSINEKRITKDLGFVKIQPTFDWASDGKGIYFPSLSRLMYLPLDKEETKEITKLKDLRIVNLSVSPDGKTVAIAGENRTSNVLRVTVNPAK